MRAEKKCTKIRQEEIAQAALKVVATQGMKALPVDRIARLVGVVPSALYRHFGDKDSILDAVLDLLEERLRLNLAKSVQRSTEPLEVVRHLLHSQIHLMMEFQALPRILFSDQVSSGSPERKARLYRIIQGLLGGLEDMFREAQANGIIRADIPPAALAAMYPGLFQPSILFWQLSGGEFDMIRQTDHAWRVFADGSSTKD